jgi:hypothetical protein
MNEASSYTIKWSSFGELASSFWFQFVLVVQIMK